VIPFLAIFLLTGNEWMQKVVVNFGIAEDQAFNVVLLGGHPKETTSSHVGRYYEAKYGNPYKNRPIPTNPGLVIPITVQFLNWITGLAETDHALKAVEQWAIDQGVPL
jgi:hypothetical protein